MITPAKTLLQQAQQKTGLTDFGDEWFLGPLQAFLESLEGPHVSDFGRTFLTRQVVKDLSRRLAIIDCLKRHPEIEETPIPPILYITGHERSGTTLLHNLLSLHSGARFLSRWELMSPTPPPETATFDQDPRREEVKRALDALRGTDLERMHWVEADDPEECVWGFMDCTGIVGMAPSSVLPEWGNWFASSDLTPTLVNYRKLIQLLTWKNPVPEGGFLVLKAPQMASHLEAFSTVFPEATFLYSHRDPYRVLKSFVTLLDIVNGPLMANSNYLEVLDREASCNLERMGKVYAKMSAFESRHPERVLNLQYVNLLNNPGEEVSRVFSEAKLPEDPELNDKVHTFLEQQKSGGRAMPRQSMSDHGYTREQVESHPLLATYLQHYQVMREESRNTGAQ
ncbi:MAG: sulfotransferase [Halioglobus sp.]